jgi:large subunit GTPase 1
MAIEVNQRIKSSEEDGEVDVEESTSNGDISSATSSGSYDPIQTGTSDEDEDVDPDSDEDIDDKGDARAKVLSVLELEDLFIASAPDLSGKS